MKMQRNSICGERNSCRNKSLRYFNAIRSVLEFQGGSKGPVRLVLQQASLNYDIIWI